MKNKKLIWGAIVIVGMILTYFTGDEFFKELATSPEMETVVEGIVEGN